MGVSGTGPSPGVSGMSGAGLLVVGTYCLTTLSCVVTLCVLAVLGREVPDQLDQLVTTVVAGVGLLLAKTWADKPAAGDGPAAPVPLEVVQTEPVPVVEIPEGQTTPRARKRLTPHRSGDAPATPADSALPL